MLRSTIAVLALSLAAVPVVGADVVQNFDLVCDPIGAVAPSGYDMDLAGPELAVVDIEAKPRRTMVVLDGRELGPVSEFDGIPGHLFLRPGPYRLELVLQGYATARFDVGVEAGCLYRIRHRLERVPGTEKASWWQRSDAAVVRRVYGPVQGGGETPVTEAPIQPARHRGPDLSLRPELAMAPPSAEVPAAARASLVIRARPAEAAVYLDGTLLGSAAELAGLELPLAVTVGAHRIEVVAPGCEPWSTEVELTEDGTETVEVALEERSPAANDS